jgi:hypothetical protein
MACDRGEARYKAGGAVGNMLLCICWCAGIIWL